jgi:hypothetical protein
MRPLVQIIVDYLMAIVDVTSVAELPRVGFARAFEAGPLVFASPVLDQDSFSCLETNRRTYFVPSRW